MFVRALTFVALLSVVASNAAADTIYYTETITGVTGHILISGSTNESITASMVITMTASADPTTITGADNPDNRTGTLSVIAPITITVTDAQGNLVYTGTPLGNSSGDTGVFFAPANLQGLGYPATAGFYDNYDPNGQGNPGGYLLATSSSQFSSPTNYGLNSSIGPVTGTSLYNAGEYFLTSNGKFEIDAPGQGDPYVNSTFTANFVPEPSSIAMTAVALLLGGGVQWRRRRAAQARVASVG